MDDREAIHTRRVDGNHRPRLQVRRTLPVGRGFVSGKRPLSLPDRSRSSRRLLSVPRRPDRHRRPSPTREVKMMKWIFTMIAAAILLGATMGAQAQTGPAYVQMKREAFQKEIGSKKTDLYTLQARSEERRVGEECTQ